MSACEPLSYRMHKSLLGNRRRPLPFLRLGSLPSAVNGPPSRRANSQLELVARDCKKALLIGSVPIRKRASLDMNSNDAIRLAYRVCPKICYGSLGCRLVFLGSRLRDLREIIGCIFGTV